MRRNGASSIQTIIHQHGLFLRRYWAQSLSGVIQSLLAASMLKVANKACRVFLLSCIFLTTTYHTTFAFGESSAEGPQVYLSVKLTESL